jgi:hypothetical protein
MIRKLVAALLLTVISANHLMADDPRNEQLELQRMSALDS